MKNIFSRMSNLSATALLALALFAGTSACSSKHAVTADTDASASEIQDDESMILGSDSSGPTNEDVLSNNSTSNVDESVLGGGVDSLPVDSSGGTKISTKASGSWHGKLHTQYQPGMTEWKVSRGESLGLIAKAVFGKTSDYKKLLALNPQLKNENDISVGTILRLPGSNNEAQAAQPAQPEQDEGGEAAAAAKTADNNSSVPTVANNATPPPAAPEAPAAAAPAAGAMGTVTPDAPAAQATGTSSAGNDLVQKVDNSANKLKMRNILLGVAAFFLLLSGVIFILSRRKAKPAA